MNSIRWKYDGTDDYAWRLEVEFSKSIFEYVQERVDKASCQSEMEIIRERAVWAGIIDMAKDVQESEGMLCYVEVFAAGYTREQNFEDMIKVRDRLCEILTFAESSLRAEEAHL